MNANCKILQVILLAVMTGANVGSAQGSNAEEYKGLFPASTQIIDVAHYLNEIDTSGTQILTVDADDRVGLHAFRKSPRGLVRVTYVVLGQAVWMSGELNLRGRIGPKEIPVFETRLTNQGTGTRFHVVVTVLLSPTPRNRHSSKVYVFSQRADEFWVALTKEYSDSPKIILDDVNGDGTPELVVEFFEDTGKAGDLDMWSLSRDDKLTKIPLPHDGEYLDEARTYFRHLEGPYHGPGNYAVVATASILRNAIPMEREIRSQWSEKTKSYRITEVTDISETRRKVPLR